jgi:hypothetical protein
MKRKKNKADGVLDTFTQKEIDEANELHLIVNNIVAALKTEMLSRKEVEDAGDEYTKEDAYGAFRRVTEPIQKFGLILQDKVYGELLAGFKGNVEVEVGSEE